MTLSKATETEIDERLELDRRQYPQAFCTYFQSEEELPEGFYELQDTIRHGLEKEFWADFHDGIDRSRMPTWKTPINDHFFFPAELLISERIIIELSEEILGDKLIAIILSYLKKNAPRYCVIGAVHKSEQNSGDYVGRFIIAKDEIVVEDSLVEIWRQNIQSLYFDKI